MDTTHPLISWRSVFAGLFVSLLAYLMLAFLGLAIGGTSLVDGLESSATSVGITTGIWIISATAISLFLGSYFAARVSRVPARIVGSSQAVVIASLFFFILVVELAATLGTAGRAVGSMMGAAGSGFADAVSAASSSPQVNDVIQQSLEGLNLKSDPKVVIEGVAVRLLKGDSEGARNFLARQAGMSNSEAQSRIDQVTEQVKTALAETREAAARTLSTAGWTLFGLMVIGLLAAIGGGALGSRTNLRRPLSDEELTPMYHTTTSAAS